MQLIWRRPQLCVKREVLYQLMLEKTLLYDVSTGRVMKYGFTGTSKYWDRNQRWSPPFILLVKKSHFIRNSTTVHASHWILKKVKITWQFLMWTFQTQLLTTAQVALHLEWLLPKSLLSVSGVQVWASQCWSTSQRLRPSSQEALWLW